MNLRRLSKLSLIIILSFVSSIGTDALRSQDSVAKQDSPMGIVVYCSFPEKEEPYSKVWERNLSLWYKAYKKRKQEEGGGSFLIASVPHLPKNSPELERLRQEIGFEILFPGEQLLSDSKQTSDKKESTDVSKTETKSAATASEKPTKRRKNKKGGKSTKKAVKESGERPDASSKQARRQTTGKREK